MVTAGQFGLSHLVEAVARQIGPASCSIATWTAGRRAIGHVRRLRVSGLLADVRWWLDPSFQRRQPAYLDAVFAGFSPAAVRLAPCHVKAVTLINAEWAVMIRGSLNLNHAVRAELIEVSEDRALASWFSSLVDDVFAAVPAADVPHDERTALVKVFGLDACAVPDVPRIFGPTLDDSARPGFSRGL
jgi:hypothetical protein